MGEFKLHTITTRIELGAEKPFKFVHISDNHQTSADERDIERKRELAKDRYRYFSSSEEILRQARELALENDTFIAHTGDLIDFVSELNYDIAKEYADSCDVFFASGNHEFSHYLGEAREDAEYRNRTLHRIQACFKNDIRFDSRKVNGINIIAIDNSYHLFEEWQLDRLKEEVKHGMPIVLLMHAPLYEETLYRYQMKERKSESAYLMAVPDELVDTYPPDRQESQRADEITKEAYEYIKSEPLIKVALTGHLHYNFECPDTVGFKQYVTGTGTARIVEIV